LKFGATLVVSIKCNTLDGLIKQITKGIIDNLTEKGIAADHEYNEWGHCWEWKIDSVKYSLTMTKVVPNQKTEEMETNIIYELDIEDVEKNTRWDTPWLQIKLRDMRTCLYTLKKYEEATTTVMREKE